MASPPHYAPADLSIDSHGYLHGNGVPLPDGAPLSDRVTSLHGDGASTTNRWCPTGSEDGDDDHGRDTAWGRADNEVGIRKQKTTKRLNS